MAVVKTACPVTRAQFTAKAGNVEVVIAGVKFFMAPKEFSTGSLGWNLSDKVTVLVDGVPVKFQVGLNLTAIGSKELPK